MPDRPMNHEQSPLPAVQAMPRDRQYHVLGLALLAVALVFAIVSLVRWMGAGTPPPAATAPPGTFRPTPDQRAGLQTMVVGARGQEDVTAASGTIAVDEDRSTPVLMPYSGQVAQVLVEAGQMVKQGQPLLTIRTSDFVDARNALFAAAATRATTTSQLHTAEANARRQEEIYRTAGGALRDYQQAQTDLVAARAAARSAQAAQGAARDKLTILGKSPAEIAALESVGEVDGIHAQTTLHAPIAGIVSQRSVSAGQYVGAGGDKPVVTISDPAHLWLVAQLAESDAAQVRIGNAVEVTTPAYPGRVFHATIDNIGAALDPVSHRLPVRASIYDPDRALKPQMFASFTISRRAPGEAILVPAAAVIHEGDGARVWIVRPDGLLAARAVQVGDETGGRVRIARGLASGERIVTGGAIFVNEAGLGS